jgi:hypothetical protein
MRTPTRSTLLQPSWHRFCSGFEYISRHNQEARGVEATLSVVRVRMYTPDVVISEPPNHSDHLGLQGRRVSHCESDPRDVVHSETAWLTPC